MMRRTTARPQRPSGGGLACFVNSLRGGGSERVMVTVVNALAGQGIDVDLVLGRAYGPYLADVSGNVRVVDFRTRSAAVGLLKLAFYVWRKKPDVLLATNVMSNVAAVVTKLVVRPRLRLVLREASTLSSALAALRGHRQWSLKWAARLAPMLYRRADALIAVSQGAADNLMRDFGIPANRVRTIYNPVLTEDVFRKAEASPEHPWLSDDVPVILAVGRLHPAKDYPTLLRAFAVVRSQRPCRLLILGEGEERRRLEEEVRQLHLEPDVAMPGFSDNPFACMRHASVFVLSSVYEGLPGTLIQAMACGCPVVSTDCKSGPSEILDHGRYGHLVATGNAEQLAEAIIAILNGEGKNVPPHWLDQFSPAPAIAAYAEVLNLSPLSSPSQT